MSTRKSILAIVGISIVVDTVIAWVHLFIGKAVDGPTNAALLIAVFYLVYQTKDEHA